MSSLVSVCRPGSGQSSCLLHRRSDIVRGLRYKQVQSTSTAVCTVHSGVAIPLFIHTFGPWKWGQCSTCCSRIRLPSREAGDRPPCCQRHKLSEIFVDRSTAAALVADRSYVPGWRKGQAYRLQFCCYGPC
jgi:hypothetical protein